MASTEASDVNSHVGTLEIATGDDPEHIERNDDATGNHPDSSRRYGGPLIQQYKFTIVSCIVAFALIIVAIALGASSLQKSNEALALSTATTEAIESEKFIIINNGNEADSDSGGATPSAPRDTPDPTPNPTPKPTTATAKPTDAPTEPHPLNPQWFQTTHDDYQSAAEGLSGVHSWHIATNMCNRQSLTLCGYDAYCPSGKGGDPFHGGPPKTSNWSTLEETQWAPFYDPASMLETGKHWVQIGLIPASEGGSNDNDFVKCWSHEDWYSGGGEDIEDVWEEEHRMWILCCENAQE
mmetsp:Transcript_18655/g.40377  ORF Transcript_18655/g.40377 Transcript_18655/m.40377 type:complete len:296 (+) Transcript_18655:101-988(+)